jgi:hypothetical protein
MEIANVWLEISDLRSNVLKRNVTPAEVSILKSIFSTKIPGTNETTNPFQHVSINPSEVVRSNQDEINRLCKIYGTDRFEECFPGSNPKLPITFAEIDIKNTETLEPTSGKLHEIPPLSTLASGDDGSDIELPSAAEAALKAKVVELEKQLAAKNEDVKKSDGKGK